MKGLNDNEYFFCVYGDPVAKGRPKFAVNRKTGRGFAYTPKTTSKWEDSIKLQAIEQLGGKPLLEGALFMQLVFMRSYPTSISKKRRETAMPVTRPDLDNYVKAVKDALNGILWRDDSQIVAMNCRKYYTDRPGVQVYVRILNGQEVLGFKQQDIKHD